MAIFIRPIHRRRSQHYPKFYDPFEDEEEFCHHHYPLHPMAATAGIMSPWNQFATPMLAQTPALIPSTLPSTLSSTMAIPDSIKNENGKFEIKCSIPSGFSPDELKLDLDGDKLILAGEKKNSTSFQRIERIFCIPDGVEKATIKCEFDPSTNQLCIEAASIGETKAVESNKGQQKAAIENKKKESAAFESTEVPEPMDVSKNPEPSESVETSIPEGSKSSDNFSIKGKDYIERETDEGIEIDTTVSAS